MIRIVVVRGHCLPGTSRLLERPMLNLYRRASSNKDNENQDKNPQNIAPVQKSKQQSLQEESYFHKEDVQQLKALKKKKFGNKNDENEKSEKKDADKTD